MGTLGKNHPSDCLLMNAPENKCLRRYEYYLFKLTASSTGQSNKRTQQCIFVLMDVNHNPYKWNLNSEGLVEHRRATGQYMVACIYNPLCGFVAFLGGKFT